MLCHTSSFVINYAWHNLLFGLIYVQGNLFFGVHDSFNKFCAFFTSQASICYKNYNFVQSYLTLKLRM